MDYLSLEMLIVGNGFDLHANQKTSYGDFHKILCDVYSSKDRGTNLEELIKKWNEEGYKTTKELGAQKLYDLINRYKGNFFIQYFANAQFKEWNNFEKELECIYKTIDYLLENWMFDYEYINLYRIEDYYKLPAYNIFKYVKKWHDFDCSMAYINEKRYIKDTALNSAKAISEKIARVKSLKTEVPKWLFSDLKEFCNIFTLYLNAFVQVNKRYCAGLSANTIVNYNYTNVAEKMINNRHTFYIHGKYKNQNCGSDQEWNQSNIVFGIDDSVEFKNKAFDRFKKTVIRCDFDTDIRMLAASLPKRPRIAGETVPALGIVGHSLDLIDADSLRMVLLSGFNKYYVFYYLEESKIDLITNLRYLLGVDTYNELYNNGKIEYRNVSELEIVDSNHN